MSDMLAVLLGAGGAKASQAIAALGGGKLSAQGAQGVQGAQGQAGSGDPFMAVLVDRMSAVEAEIGLAGEGAPKGAAALPLKALEAALVDAQSTPVDPAAQAASAASMIAPIVLAATSKAVPSAAAGLTGAAAEAALPATSAALSASQVLVGNSLEGGTSSKPTKTGKGMAALMAEAGTAGGGKNAAAKGSGAAENALSGQILPQGRGQGEGVSQPRVDAAQMAASPGAGSMIQALADQAPGKAVDALSGSGSMAHTPGLGASHGMMPADAQGRTTSVSVAHLAVDVPLKSPAFAQELGDRIVWLSSRNGHVADIALNPSHLGPLEVKLSLSGGEAGAQFFSPHPQVRDAIEAALPRLREMMADAGLNLGQAHVRDESLNRQAQGGQADNPTDSALPGLEDAQDSSGVQQGFGGLQRGRGLVDLYA